MTLLQSVSMNLPLLTCLCLLGLTWGVFAETDKPCLKNVALYKPATQSSKYSVHGRPHVVVDGNANSADLKECTMTATGANNWWRVDLLYDYKVYAITITAYNCCPTRLKNFVIYVTQGAHATPHISADESRCLHRGDPVPVGGTITLDCDEPIVGRYVTLVMLNSDYLTLCQLKVLGTPASQNATMKESLTNVALNKPASQSTQHVNLGSPQSIVDGTKDSKLFRTNCASTLSQQNPWWRVDLINRFKVYSVVITNRGDCCGNRLKDFSIYVTDGAIYDPTKSPHNTLCVHHLADVAQGATIMLDCNSPIEGKYVTLVLSGSTVLNFCELEVLGKAVSGPSPAAKPCLTNVALYKPATQSSTVSNQGTPMNVVDGSTTNSHYKFCTVTKAEANSWWRVDLLADYKVYSVVITNRADCCGTWLKNFNVLVSKDIQHHYVLNPEESLCLHHDPLIKQGATISLDCDQPMVGRYVTLVHFEKTALTFCEFEVLGIPASPAATLRESLVNMALNKPASQSSMTSIQVPQKAVDGNRQTSTLSECTRTTSETGAWWRVDLLQPVKVYSVVITNIGTGGQYLKNFHIYVTKSAPYDPTITPHDNICLRYQGPIPNAATITLNCNEPMVGKYVTLVQHDRSVLTLCELEVLGIPEPLDPCDPNPCHNGGTCKTDSKGAPGNYECKCTSDFSGTNCDEPSGDFTPPGDTCLKNVALYKPATQSSTYSVHGRPHVVVDGNANSADLKECTMTTTGANNWWRVDLLDDYKVYAVTITAYNCCEDRLKNFNIYVTDIPRYNPHITPEQSLCLHRAAPVPIGGTITLNCNEPVVGRYVTLVILHSTYLTICQLKVLGAPASHNAMLRESLTNVAVHKPTAQSSQHVNLGKPQNIVDGTKQSRIFREQCTSTLSQLNPWWRVDLINRFKVYSVIITNRGDCCGNRMKDFSVFVTESAIYDPKKSPYNTLCVYQEKEVPQGATVVLDCKEPIVGKYVTLMLEGSTILNLCELEVRAKPVYGTTAPEKPCLTNVALYKPATQSSTVVNQGSPMNVVDGSTTNSHYKFCTITKSETYPWWSVDLLADYKVYSVVITNRGDCCGKWLKNFNVLVTKEPPHHHIMSPEETRCLHYSPPLTQGATLTLDCDKPIVGRYVTIFLFEQSQLTFCELEVLGIPASPEAKLRESLVNVALNKPATQVSGTNPQKSVDGNKEGISTVECSRTSVDANPWWRVDLIEETKVYSVVISNLATGGQFLKNFDIYVTKSAPYNPSTTAHEDLCLHFDKTIPNDATIVLDCEEPMVGKYVTLVLLDRSYLNLCEMAVLSLPGNIDPCDPNPCQNEGTCSTDKDGQPGNYQCSCPEGFKGTNCEEAPDPCDCSPCQNGGTCYSEQSGQTVSYSCSCPTDYKGDHCEILPEWLQDKCKEDSDCSAENSQCFKRRCLCKPGFFFSVGSNACLRTCKTSNLHATYTAYPTGMIKRNKLFAKAGKTAQECQAACNDNEACLSFTFLEGKKGMKCFFHAKTAKDVGGLFRMNKKGSTYYQKNCD